MIGKRCKDVAEESALDVVFGYTCLNDVSARDKQRATTQWFAGKTLDDTCPLGPWIVTADEIGDPQKLDVSLRVNGEEKQHASTAVMIFSVARCIAELSQGTTLEPGDIIATGTPEGVGFARTPPEFLKDGDVMEVEIEKIGVLRNPVKIDVGQGGDDGHASAPDRARLGNRRVRARSRTAFTPTPRSTSASWSASSTATTGATSGSPPRFRTPATSSAPRSASARSSWCAARDGSINVVENRCAHRGVQFCQKAYGSTKTFVCPYHQWSYDLGGNLIGVPFRKGVRQGDRVNGGMPDDFELGRPRPDEAEGRGVERRDLRLVRSRRRAAARRSSARRSGATSSACSTAAS